MTYGVSVRKGVAVSGPVPGAAADDHYDIGGKLKRLRKEHRLSLQEMADRSGISIGQISQIERGRSSPSVRTLVSLCCALGLTVGTLFNGVAQNRPSEAQWIVRLGNRRSLQDSSHSYRKFLLSPDLNGGHQIYLGEFDPQASSGDEAHDYSGDTSGVLIEGNLELQIDDAVFLLEAGDAFRIPPSAKRLYRNPGRRVAKIIWCISAPVDAGSRKAAGPAARNGAKALGRKQPARKPAARRRVKKS